MRKVTMMIDKISGINPLNNVQTSKRTAVTEGSYAAKDEISVSDEAKELAETYYLNKVAADTPDVRMDLVEQVKLKIQDPNYFSDANIAATADKILSSWGI